MKSLLDYEEDFKTGDFHENRQQEVLVGATLLRLIRINGSSLCNAKDLIQSRRI